MLKLWNQKLIRTFVAGAVLSAVTVPQVVAGDVGPKPLQKQSIKTKDVKLDASGALRVRLVDTQGNGVKSVEVTIKSSAGIESRATTDASGQAVFADLRPGLHMIPTGTTVEVVRVWTAELAPPKAIDSVAVVVDDETIVRGQAIPFVTAGGGGTGVSPLTLLTLGSLGLATYATIEANDLQNQIDILNASP